jgi:hypothetical protein
MFAAVSFACVGGLRGEEPAIIKAARAYLGTESALARIVTIHFSGTVTTPDPKDPKKVKTESLEIVLQKPDRQRVTISDGTQIDMTGLNGYEGWHRVASTTDPTKWQEDFLAVPTIKKLRAQTLEGLNFFRGYEKVGGTVVDEGEAMKEGVPCRKVSFTYAPDIVFVRYFDAKTGRLVITETANSALMERGEQVVDGVRFPKSLVQVSILPNGTTTTIVTTFDKVTTNDLIPSSYFDAPPTTWH